MIANRIANVDVYTDPSGLDKLRLMSRKDPDKALEVVARQFEALFTQALLKSMRNSTLADGIFDNDQTRLYQDLFDKQISNNLSQSKGMGLADVLIKQLSPRAVQATESNSQYISFEKYLPVIKAPEPSGKTGLPYDFSSPEDYLRKMYPLAKEVESSHRIPAIVLLAQSALETGWGKHIIRSDDGSSSYNLFGIKADSRWAGNVSISKTIEYSNGIPEVKNAKFRAYDSFAQSMEDYADFLGSNPRYNSAINNASNPERFINSLHHAGYATDPDYSNKINNIMASYGFLSTIESLKNAPTRPLS